MTPRRKKIAEYLAVLYGCYNRRDLVSPDPLQFLYGYGRTEDREIAALIASSLAYGRVAQILRSVEAVLGAMGPSPRHFVERGTLAEWREIFHGFRHRFTDGDDVAYLLDGVRRVIADAGRLGIYLARARAGTGSLTGALDSLIERLENGRKNTLLSRPALGSACKRHFLMLRWMGRRDRVDPGGWDSVNPAELIVPLDTHMYQICRALRFTRRRTADLKTAGEVTAVFRQMCPLDPVRYDFVLTRFGIRDDLDQDRLIEECRAAASGLGE